MLNPVKTGMVKKVDQWKWSSYLDTVGQASEPNWLSSDYLLSQFSVQRKTAIRKCQAFVQEGLKQEGRGQVFELGSTFLNITKYKPA